MDPYAVGDVVLVTRYIGQDFTPPLKATVIQDTVNSMIYAYEVETDPVELTIASSGVTRDHMYLMVKPDWVVPFHYVIDEVAETPWD